MIAISRGGGSIKRDYLSAFETRQVMRSEDYEIFHHVDAYSAGVPPHGHDFYELYCLLSDSVTLSVEGRRYPLEAGGMLLIRPGERHLPELADSRRPVERIVLWINSDYVDRLIGGFPTVRQAFAGEPRGGNRVAASAETIDLMHELLFGLLRERNGEGPESAALCELMLTQLLIHVGRNLNGSTHASPARSERRDAGVIRVYEYISAHLCEDLTVSRLAELFFMDKNTLTRQFKRLTGMTPGECVRRSRLEAAHAMIAAGARSQEACAECGFSDYSAFYRAFRQMYGMSPSALIQNRSQTGGSHERA